jgi:VanZ family protein
MPLSRFRKVALAAAIVWTAAIFLLCLWPGEQLPKSDLPFADKWTHFVLFGAFSLLWLLALSGARLRTVLLLICIAAALGWMIECLQGWLPALHRSRDYYDALADALGGLLGGLAYLIAQRIWPVLKGSSQEH